MLMAASAERYRIRSFPAGSVATRTLSKTPLLHMDTSKSTSRYTSDSVAGSRPAQNSFTSGMLVPSMHSAPTVATAVGQPPPSRIAIAGRSRTLMSHAMSTKKVLVFIVGTALCGPLHITDA